MFDITEIRLKSAYRYQYFKVFNVNKDLSKSVDSYSLVKKIIQMDTKFPLLPVLRGER